MSKTLLLYLTADRLRWYRMEAGTMRLESQFAADSVGVAEFSAQLRERGNRGAQYSILVDVADEGFHVDHVPAIRGRDRSDMLQRKLSQQFYGSPYATAVTLGREKEGRRDERILFSALTRPAQLEPWIKALTEARVRVRGVHSVPFMLDRIMARSRIPTASYLLISFTPAGIRQTYFNEGRLRFSRLSGGHDQSAEQQLADSGEEIRKTLAYLSAQRLTRRGEQTPIVGLVWDRQFAEFRRVASAVADTPILLAEAGQLIGAFAPPARADSNDSLGLLLGALASESQCPQIGGQEVLRFQGIHQVRAVLCMAALGVVLAGGLLGAMQLYERAAVRSEAASLRQLEAVEQARYQALMAALPRPPAPLDELRRLIAEIDRTKDGAVPALAVFGPLSQALDQFPEIALDRLAWRTEVGPGAVSEIAMVASASLRLPAALAGNQRAMIEASEQFVAELGRLVQGRVRVLRRPVDIRSTQTLRGQSADSGAAPEPAPSFEVEIEFSSGRSA